MKIKLKSPTEVSGKMHATGTVMYVINEIGMRLVVQQKAYCMDGTFGTNIKISMPTKLAKPKKKVSTTKTQ